MTIVAYARGVLAADSRAIHTGKSNSGHHGLTAYNCEKFKCFDGLFAVVVCGTTMTKEAWVAVGEIFKSKIMLMEVVDKVPQALLSEDELKKVGAADRHFIVMTRAHVYFLSGDMISEKGLNGFSTLDPGEHLMYGSASKPTHVAVMYGYDARQAIEFAATIDASCGGEIHSIRQDELRSLIPTAKKPRRVK